MKISEILREEASAGASSSAAVATVAQPLGGVIKRSSIAKPAKYSNSVKTYNGNNKNARR